MDLRYEFSEDDFLTLCLKNLARKKTTVFEDLYETLRHFLSTPDSVVITDVRHRSHPEYYDDHLSLKEYIDKGKLLLPYVEFDLSSDKNTDLEVTDITIPPFVKLNDFQYGGGITQRYKIKNTKLKTKNKSSICLLSVEFPQALLIRLYSLMTPPEGLLPSKLGVWEWKQTFYNKMTGESYFCSCFKDALAKEHVGLVMKHAHLMNALKNNSFIESICHICTKTNSDFRTFHSKTKFWFYDLLLIDILFENNKVGNQIFSALFNDGKAALIFKFLDEETSILEDLRVIWKCPKGIFIKALFNRMLKTKFNL